MYGLAESGEFWGRTFWKHLDDDLGIKSFMSGTALFFKRIGDKSSGLCATYVDDALQARDSKYSLLTKLTEAKI